MTGPLPVCVCGHGEAEHEHWRDGSDCGRCGPRRCARFTPVGPPALSPEARRLLAVVLGVPVAVVTVAAVGAWLGSDAAACAALALLGAVAVWLVIRPIAHHPDDAEDRCDDP